MKREISIADIARVVGGEIRGQPDVIVYNVNDVSEAGPDDLTFITSTKYEHKLRSSRAGAVLVPADFGSTSMPAILCERVDRALAQTLALFVEPLYSPEVGVHPLAVVGEGVRIGQETAIGACVTIGPDTEIGDRCKIFPGVYIGSHVSIGADCVIGPNSAIYDRCELGKRVQLKACAVIGGDGFGFYLDKGRHTRVPHTGIVVIEDDVEIGSCTCVDRSKFGATRIRKGTKFDNQVQVGHNVRIGEHCLLASQVALSGSTHLGNYCVLAGRAAATEGVTLGDRVTVAAQSIVTHSIEDGKTVWGFPAGDITKQKRIWVAQQQLLKLIKQVKQLAERVEHLEASADNRE